MRVLCDMLLPPPPAGNGIPVEWYTSGREAESEELPPDQCGVGAVEISRTEKDLLREKRVLHKLEEHRERILGEAGVVVQEESDEEPEGISSPWRNTRREQLAEVVVFGSLDGCG